MASEVNPLTLTREELYELVWSKPMVELAKDFGLSDVAVAKRCRRLGVPVPGRGYWARVAAGQTPRQAPLKKRTDQDRDYAALTFDAPKEDPADSALATTAEQSALRERIERLEFTGSDDLRSAVGAVKRTAVQLKRPWRKEIAWGRGERKGPVISINVSDPLADRALLACHRLLTGASALGWTYVAPPKASEPRERSYGYTRRVREPPPIGHLLVEGEALSFRIDERRRQIDHVMSEDDKARQRRGEYVFVPRWDFEPSGEIRLHMSESDSRCTTRTWKDGARARLEDQTKSILTGLADEALSIKAAREGKRLEEIEARRREIRRLQQSQRRDAHTKLVHALEVQAGAWLRARLLHRYLRALRAAVGTERIEAPLQDKRVDFIAWAEHYVDQLDPLSRTPHDRDLKEDSYTCYRGSERLQEALRRLTGQEWQDAWKLRVSSQDESPSGDSGDEDDND